MSTDAPPLAPAHRRPARAVGWWLVACAVLVYAMVVLGGVTRLTGSGLSMVRWHPIHGVLPPIGEDAWRREFEVYRASPEYRLVNRGMSLAEFKGIFWMEYAHRMLGRGVGIAFLVPFLVFLAMRGLRATKRMGRYLAETGLIPDAIVCSTAPRAVQTVLGAAQAGGFTLRPVRFEAAIYEASLTTLLDVLGECDP